MSMYKRSWIGASHSAQLQRHFATIPIFYVMGMGAIIGIITGLATHAVVGLFIALFVVVAT